MCKDSNYGVEQIDRNRLDELIDELAAANPTPRPAESPKFSGNWKLLWTTESELLFAVEKGSSRPGRVLASSKPSTSQMAGSRM